MAAKGSKKLTAAEKRLNAQVKKELQARGRLPPDKPKLNRKKFIEEARKEWNEVDVLTREIYLIKAIWIMLGKTDRNFNISLEAVGCAKALKLAVRLKEFSQKLEKEGRVTYTLKEEIEFIQDILDA